MSEGNRKVVRFTGLSSAPDDISSPSGHSGFWNQAGGPLPHLAFSLPPSSRYRSASVLDLGAVRSPSPIENRPYIPDLDNLRSPSPMESSPYIPDLGNLRLPSPIDDRPYVPDLSSVRSPSPITTRPVIPDLSSVRSPSPVPSRPFIPDLSSVRSPSPISGHPFIPDLSSVRSPSPIPSRPFIPDLSAIQSPSPIENRSQSPVQTSIQSSSSVPSLSIHDKLANGFAKNGDWIQELEENALAESMSHMSLHSRPPGTQGAHSSHGRAVLVMDEIDLFFWSVVRTNWFGPNVLLNWRQWAKDNQMTIKLMEDLLDYPQRYADLFKNFSLEPSCQLPTDELGRFVVPLVEVSDEESKSRLKFILVSLPMMAEQAGFEDLVQKAKRISQEVESSYQEDGTLTSPEAVYIADMAWHLADRLGRFKHLMDWTEALLRETDTIDHRSTEAFVKAWSRHLRGAAGIPELRMMETRSLAPNILTQIYEIPYPDIPPHPSTNLSYPDDELDDTEKLIANMTELSSAIADLRTTTSRVFGTAHYDNLARQK
ncbi:hypothetical protein QCA50_013753 [Cerrena zonata]|uniref:Uncharacterized protein n=1 Tax=Cerrena zonata TaxID=2478898 RepID=A0AAW0G204_9APHY